MKKTTEKNISFENSEKLEQKWAEEIAKTKISDEGCIRIAISEEGDTKMMMSISEAMIPAIIQEINNLNPELFSLVSAEIALNKITESFASFLENSDTSSEDNSEKADEAEDTPES